MDELVAFLNARLDEDERVAKAATPGPWTATYDGAMHEVLGADGVAWIAFTGDEGGEPEPRANATYIACHDPARVLADVAAKRAIVELHQPRLADLRPRVVCMTCATSTSWGDADEYPCATIKLLALPYADHPDYDALRWELSV